MTFRREFSGKSVALTARAFVGCAKNGKLADACATYPDRLVAFATVSMNFPDLDQEEARARRRWYHDGRSAG